MQEEGKLDRVLFFFCFFFYFILLSMIFFLFFILFGLVYKHFLQLLWWYFPFFWKATFNLKFVFRNYSFLLVKIHISKSHTHINEFWFLSSPFSCLSHSHHSIPHLFFPWLTLPGSWLLVSWSTYLNQSHQWQYSLETRGHQGIRYTTSGKVSHFPWMTVQQKVRCSESLFHPSMEVGGRKLLVLSKALLHCLFYGSFFFSVLSGTNSVKVFHHFLHCLSSSFTLAAHSYVYVICFLSLFPHTEGHVNIFAAFHLTILY